MTDVWQKMTEESLEGIAAGPLRACPYCGGQAWIACSERMPSGYDEVLAWDGDTVKMFLPDTGEAPEAKAPERCALFGITHWMPKPRPPKVGDLR